MTLPEQIEVGSMWRWTIGEEEFLRVTAVFVNEDGETQIRVMNEETENTRLVTKDEMVDRVERGFVEHILTAYEAEERRRFA